MNTTQHWRIGLAGLLTAWSLFGCGGGSNSTSSASSNDTPPPAPAPVPQEQGAPVVTNNVAVDGRNWLNYRRGLAGLSTLTQNGNIDTAAQAHSDYQKLNDTVDHGETLGKPGYTGARLEDRLAAGGYVLIRPWVVGEVISATSNNSGVYMAEELITAIYHRFVIFEPKFREIGAGAARTSSNYNYFTADFGSTNGLGAGLGHGNVAAWPYSGQLNVPTNFFSDNELPDPMPAPTYGNEVGYPISVQGDINLKMTVQQFTVRQHGAAADVAVRLMMPNENAEVPVNAAAIIPLAPLKAATMYDVTFIGTSDSAAVNKSWSFTTK